MTYLEIAENFGEDYNNFHYTWHNTFSRTYFNNVNEIIKKLNSVDIFISNENINENEITMIKNKVREKIVNIYYEKINIDLVYDEMRKLLDFITNNTRSIFFDNDYGKNNKNELKNLLENFMNRKMLYDDIETYDKAIALYYFFNTIDGYFISLRTFCDLFIEIKLYTENV
jgi:hypothetical protein